MFDVDQVGQNGEFCIGCGARLVWGKFAYKQELCWDCFEKKVNYITQDIKGADDVDIIKHLLNISKLFAAKWR